MDFLDICEGRYYQTYSGRYYQALPYLDPDAPPAIFFDYEYIDLDSRAYRHIVQNITDDKAADVSIKTRAQLNFRANQYISLEDGRLFAILSVAIDRASASREAARLFPLPMHSEFIIRLVEVDNPRGL